MLTALTFLIGALLGLVGGAITCVRYIRQELTAQIGPNLDLLQLRVANLQSTVDLLLSTRHIDLYKDSTWVC